MEDVYYPVSKDLILRIAEHCDLKTLNSLMLANKDLHSFISLYQHSIAKSQIALLDHPSKGPVLDTRDGHYGSIIFERNSLDTVRELQRRQKRAESLLERGAFLLTDSPDSLDLPSQESLRKFRLGLGDAFQIADHIADIGAEPPMEDHSQNTNEVDADSNHDLMSMELEAFRASLAQDLKRSVVLRNLQLDYIRAQPTRILCWLLTLASGCSRGYSRYCNQMLYNDPGMAWSRLMAFAEQVLRSGVFFVWGFVRGGASMASKVRDMHLRALDDIHWYEASGHWTLNGEDVEMPDGLHMTIMKELAKRFIAEKKAAMDEAGEVWDEEEWRPKDTCLEANRFVAEEIGAQGWNGYAHVGEQQPPLQ